MMIASRNAAPNRSSSQKRSVCILAPSARMMSAAPPTCGMTVSVRPRSGWSQKARQSYILGDRMALRNNCTRSGGRRSRPSARRRTDQAWKIQAPVSNSLRGRTCLQNHGFSARAKEATLPAVRASYLCRAGSSGAALARRTERTGNAASALWCSAPARLL
jgi:predicted secreted protein